MELSLTIKSFNEKVKQMNQTNGRQLVLSAQEARNLHNDIFVLLATVAEQSVGADKEVVQITMDGGGFK